MSNRFVFKALLFTFFSILALNINAAAQYTAIVSINGNQVIAQDANGTVIQSGVAGVDDAAVVNYVLNSSNTAVVCLAPSTTFTFNQTIAIAGSQGNANQRLIGGGKFSTVVNYSGSDPCVIHVNATSRMAYGVTVSDMTINASGYVGIYIQAIAPCAATKLIFERLHLKNVSTGIKLEGTGANEIYKNSFRDISIYGVGPDGYGIYATGGCYNLFSGIEIVLTGNNSYAILNGLANSSFFNVSCDGCIREQGQSNIWVETSIETIHATTPPTTAGAFRMAGFYCTIIGLELTNIDPVKCSTGLWVYGDDHLINGMRCWGTVNPAYPLVTNAPTAGKSCTAVNIKAPDASNWAGLSFSGWKYIGCKFKTGNSGSSTGTGVLQTIAHSLIKTPNNVSIVPTAIGTIVSDTRVDATNIYVTVTNGKSFNWSAAVN